MTSSYETFMAGRPAHWTELAADVETVRALREPPADSPTGLARYFNDNCPDRAGRISLKITAREMKRLLDEAMTPERIRAAINLYFVGRPNPKGRAYVWEFLNQRQRLEYAVEDSGVLRKDTDYDRGVVAAHLDVAAALAQFEAMRTEGAP